MSISQPPAESSAQTGGVSREEVIWSYRLILGRDPESEEAINTHLSLSNRAELIRVFMRSAEFRRSGKTSNIHHFFSTSNPPLIVEYEPSEEKLARLLERVRLTWVGLGESAPHWSVLSSPEFLPENIEATKEAFHASGAKDAAAFLATIRRVGRDPAEFATIHEFGCGLGRSTNHLAKAFGRVIACDISSSHLNLAREHSNAIGAGNISYREISLPDFGVREPIDLWFSVIVLQHNPPPIMLAILRRVFAGLRPGGLAVFQIPTYAVGYRFTVDEYVETPAQAGAFEMHVLPQGAIFDLLRQTGCQLLELVEDGRTVNAQWLSNTFVVERPRS